VDCWYVGTKPEVFIYFIVAENITGGDVILNHYALQQNETKKAVITDSLFL